MNLFTYWEQPMPDFIEVCLASARHVCDVPGVNYYVVRPETLHEHLPSDVLHPNYQKLGQPALRADCIRAALLYWHGGWWWDADTIALRSPLELMRTQPTNVEAIYMQWDTPPPRVLNGYIYLAKETPFAMVWLDRINDALEKDFDNIDWCDLGEKLLTRTLPELPGTRQIPRSLFLPIDIDSDVKRFFEPGEPCDLIEDDTVAFGLNYSWMMYHKPEEMAMPPEQWAKSPLLIHRLLDMERKKRAGARF